MTTHRTSIGPLFFALLGITTIATAQQRISPDSGVKQTAEASHRRSPAMQRMTGIDAKQKGIYAQTSVLDVTKVSATEDIDRTAKARRNGHFVSSGTAALIPVSRVGWHDISGWREIRRAQSAR